MNDMSPIQQLATELEPYGFTIRSLPHLGITGADAWFVVRTETPDAIYEPLTYDEGLAAGVHGVGGRFWFSAMGVEHLTEADAARHLRFQLTNPYPPVRNTVRKSFGLAGWLEHHAP